MTLKHIEDWGVEEFMEFFEAMEQFGHITIEDPDGLSGEITELLILKEDPFVELEDDA